MVMVFKVSNTDEKTDVIVKVLVGVADVRDRQLQAAETTSQAKYTTATGVVEQEGEGGGEETGVGVMAGELETWLDEFGISEGYLADCGCENSCDSRVYGINHRTDAEDRRAVS